MRALFSLIILAPLAVGQNVTNTDTLESFATIQAAIDDADTLNGHSLEMQVGTHAEGPQVFFTKSLTLRGDLGGTTLITTANTGSSGDARGWFLTDYGTDVTFENLVFDGSGFLIWQGIRNHGTLTITDSEFTEIKYNESGPHYSGAGVATFDATGLLTVTDCTFSEIGRIGIHIFEPAIVERVSYTGKGPGDWLDYAMCIDSFGASLGVATVSDCTIKACRGVASSDGSGSGGLLISTFFGAGTEATIERCSISDCTLGINVGFDSLDTSDVTITSCSIAGNDFGVVNTSASNTIDSTGNWWGHASGPEDLGGTFEADSPGTCFPSDFAPASDVVNADGLGDFVDDGNVDYCPWLLSAAELVLTIPDCQDDADAAPGNQIAIQLEMLSLTGHATGFQAFLDYDMGALMYRGDLSSYTTSPFPLHISPILQGDDGSLALDGSALFGGTGTTSDSVLATLVFDVVTECGPQVPLTFDLGGAFPSELSFQGSPIATGLSDAPAVTLDDTAPVLSGTPASFSQVSDAGSCAGAVVSWVDPTATDNCDPSPAVVCTPASGSFFTPGNTLVTCTATDDCGNVSMSTFNVEVLLENAVMLDVELVGVNEPVTRCIYFRMSDCANAASASLGFVDHDLDDIDMDGIDDATFGDPSTPVRASAIVNVPCGAATFMCAKDAQHTKWDTTGVTIVGASFVGDTLLSLEGGDTDNDGDVDINDVTLFVFQFGDLDSPGGCPWDGVTRDADFSNNGAVAAEDYGFLTASFLSTSSCACSGMGPGNGDLSITFSESVGGSALMGRVDLNADRRFDYRDLEIFEQRNGLPNSLSRELRRLSNGR